MKLRMTAGSIRLRLSQTDIRNFAEKGVVEEEVRFGSSDDQRFVYRLERSADVSMLAANYTNNKLTLTVPAASADNWTSTELVGISNENASSPLAILLEKDFTCLTPRAGEDDKDTFPHPRAGQNC